MTLITEFIPFNNRGRRDLEKEKGTEATYMQTVKAKGEVCSVQT